jgi:hypothetical protein
MHNTVYKKKVVEVHKISPTQQFKMQEKIP